MMKAIRRAARCLVDLCDMTVTDPRENRRFRQVRTGERFFVLRYPGQHPHFYRMLLRWLEKNSPETRALFELRSFSPFLPDAKNYRLFIPWVQDPVQQWWPSTYRHAAHLTRRFDSAGVPIINRIDRLANARKSAGAKFIASTGLRTARMELILNSEEFFDTAYGMQFPLFVREDQGHGGVLARADSFAELRAIRLDRFQNPVAVELIDVRSSDGLYRKYRYVVSGNVGIAQTFHTHSSWIVRGDCGADTPELRDEERRFTSESNPNHAKFVAAREAMGLDFVAFDYAIDSRGRAVVWEANPFPHLRLGAKDRPRHQATIRILAAMTKLYLDRAGLPVPDVVMKFC